MSAIRMICERCGHGFISGVVGMTPWPAHVCPDGTKGAPARMASTDEWKGASNVIVVPGATERTAE